MFQGYNTPGPGKFGYEDDKDDPLALLHRPDPNAPKAPTAEGGLFSQRRDAEDLFGGPRKDGQPDGLESQAASTGASNALGGAAGATPWGLIAAAGMQYLGGVDKISKKKKIGLGDVFKITHPAQGGMFGSGSNMASLPNGFMGRR